MSEEFAVGDTVRLTSGSPIMTLTHMGKKNIKVFRDRDDQHVAGQVLSFSLAPQAAEEFGDRNVERVG